MYRYMILGICLLFDVASSKECEERPLNVVIDSTNSTTREDFRVFINIIGNVSSRLEEAYNNNSLSVNIHPYSSNKVCRGATNKCVKRSLNDASEPTKVDVYGNISLVPFRRYESQPFCLPCANRVLRQLMKTWGNLNNTFGVILTVYPSLKPSINPTLHRKYKNNTSYILAMVYNSQDITASSVKERQPHVFARIISRSHKLVDKILGFMCHEKFPFKRRTPKVSSNNKSIGVKSISTSINTDGFKSTKVKLDTKTYSTNFTSMSPERNYVHSTSKLSEDISFQTVAGVTQPLATIGIAVLSSSAVSDKKASYIFPIAKTSVSIEGVEYSTSVHNSTTVKTFSPTTSSISEDSGILSGSRTYSSSINSSNSISINSSDAEIELAFTRDLSIINKTSAIKFISKTITPMPTGLVNNVSKSFSKHSKSIMESKANTSILGMIKPSQSLSSSFIIPSVIKVYQIENSTNVMGTPKLSEKELPSPHLSTKILREQTINISSISLTPSIISNAIVSSMRGNQGNDTSVNYTKIMVEPSKQIEILNRFSRTDLDTIINSTYIPIKIIKPSKSVIGNYTLLSTLVVLFNDSWLLPNNTQLLDATKSTGIFSTVFTKDMYSENSSQLFMGMPSRSQEISKTSVREGKSDTTNVSIEIDSSKMFSSIPITSVTFSGMNETGETSKLLIVQQSQSSTKMHTSYILDQNQTYMRSSVSAVSATNPSISLESNASKTQNTSKNLMFTHQIIPSKTVTNLILQPLSSRSSSYSTNVRTSIISTYLYNEVTQMLAVTSVYGSPTYSIYFTSSVTSVPPFINKVVKDITSFMEQNITKVNIKQKTWIKEFIRNTSTLLDKIDEDDENTIVQKKSLNFLAFIENTTLQMAKELSVGENVTVNMKQLKVEITSVDPLVFDGYVFSPQVISGKEEENVRLSSNIFNNVSLAKKKISITSMLTKTVPAMRKTDGPFQDIGKLFTISLDVHLPFPIENTVSYTFQVPQNNYSNYKCVFWNSTGWDTKGCRVANISGTSVSCECDHMTSFSLLMQVVEFEIEEVHAYILSMISYIGCSISIMGCVLLMLTYMMCGRLLKVSRNIIHMNLAIAIAISNALFMSADAVHMYRSLCLTVSIAMLYSYLATFFWMLVEGIHVYLMIVKVFKSPNMTKVYIIIGWFLPAVIVAIAGMKFHVNFTRDDFCWISTEGRVIWVFVGPVLFVVLTNSIILITALSTTYKMAIAENDFLKLQQVARLTMLLMPIFGLTWVFGLLAINKQLIVFQYIFTIINSLQGVYIFVCYCLLNNEVKQEFERIRRKYQYGSGATTGSSSSNFSVYDQLFSTRRLKSVVSVDSSAMVKLTRYDSKLNRYDSVKTESTRASSTYSDTLTKRNRKYSIELINLNDANTNNTSSCGNNETQSLSSSMCAEEHDYGVKLHFEEVPLSNGHYRSSDFDNCTYDTFRGKR